MNTTPTPGAVATYFGTTLRVTTAAVELRDRSYRLDNVKSVRVTRVRSNRAMFGLLFPFAAIVLGTIYFSLSMVFTSDIFALGTDLGNGAALMCLAFNLALITGLVLFYRAIMKDCHYIYLARLQRKLWYTEIAASLRPEPVDRVVASVNQALDMIRNGGAPAEPATLYYEEHSIRIEDGSINVDGQVYTTGSLTHASIDTIGTLPWFVLALNYMWSFLFITLFNVLLRNLPSETALVLMFGIVVGICLILLAAARVIQRASKDAGKAIGNAYECKLHTANETMVAFASTDEEYTRAAVDAVTAAIRRQAPSSRRRSGTSRRSQRIIP
ncbi:MAG: hypothetical protein M3437_01145 [Chloroflexota bacterium]|nr:hypothetical protein [Chloroflexota bacterium]MDQ5864288.1 hypothetical protein [Chloroflexota bacterium]